MKKLLSFILTLVILFGAVSAYAEDWTCLSCGNTATGNFCNNCGSAKPSDDWVCSACGYSATGKFCSNCGAARSTNTPAATEAPLATAEAPQVTVAPTPAPISSQDAAAMVSEAIAHQRVATKPSPDKYTWYIQDYVGMNASSVGYTSSSGNRIDEQYGPSYVKIQFVAIDGSYVDIDDDAILSQYVVVGQNYEPNTALTLVYQKNSSGKEYNNLIDFQSIETIDLLVAKKDGTITWNMVDYSPVVITPSPDKYTCYIRNYVGKNAASFAYTSFRDKRLEEYSDAYLQFNFVTADGTYLDYTDIKLLQQYVVVGQNLAPNTMFKLVYSTNSKGEEYSNLIDSQGIETIDLQVVRLDGGMYNDPVSYTPVAINVYPDKYTCYIKNYVGKNLAAFGYTSSRGKRLDEYSDAYIEFVLITPDGSAVDADDDNDLASYVVVGQDIAPNSPLTLTYQKNSKGEEYSNLVANQTYNKITLTLAKVNLIPVDESANPVLDIPAGAVTPETVAKPITTDVRKAGVFTYVVQKDNTAMIVGYSGTGSTVSISSSIGGYEVGAIGPCVFEGHTEIKDIIMWADPVTIGDRAFMGCTSLSDISISSECTSIGASAFEGCSKLKTVILWGDPEIGNRAFMNCTSLKEISIGSDTKKIGDSAFQGCTSLKSAIIWGGTTIGKSSFLGCTALKTMSIDSDTDSIGDYAFWGCTNLTSVIIWGHNTKTGVGAFDNCPKLKSFSQW